MSLPAAGKDDAAVKDGFPVLLPREAGLIPRFSHPFQKGGRIRLDSLPPENRPPVSAGEFKVPSCRLYYGRFRNSGEIFPAGGEYAPQFPCADFQAEPQLSEEIPEGGDNPVP